MNEKKDPGYIRLLPLSTNDFPSCECAKIFIENGVVNGRFCPQSVRNFCPIVAGFNAGTYKVPACVL